MKKSEELRAQADALYKEAHRQGAVEAIGDFNARMADIQAKFAVAAPGMDAYTLECVSDFLSDIEGVINGALQP